MTTTGDRILRVREVSERVGLCRTTIWSLTKQGSFPRSVRLTDYAVGWRASDIDAWIRDRSAAT